MKVGSRAPPPGRFEPPAVAIAPALPRPSTRAPVLAIAGCALLAAALRLPYLSAGLMPDEGGYAYVARRWSQGAPLYDEAWADRPQGLLLAFRALLAIAAEPWAVRLGALIAGAGITILLGVIGWQLRDPATGVVAAALYAVVGVGPHVNAFTFNGELAAALPATGAVAAALAWRSTRRWSWLVVAGLAGGTAMLMKQSGFDGVATAAAVVLLATTAWAQRRHALAVLAASTALPLLASATHGALVGWDRYWFAVVGYRRYSSSGRFDIESAIHRAGRFLDTADDAARDLGVVALLAMAALVLMVLRREPVSIAAIWLAAALVGFHAGGLYWRHYYVQLIAPLALLAALAVTALANRALQSLAVGAALLPVAVFFVGFATAPPDERRRLVPHQRAFEDHRRLAAQINDRAAPGDSIYILVSEPDLYLLLDRPSRYPYLWGHPVLEIPGARARLRALLDSPARPEWVVVFDPPHDVDPSGQLEAILHRKYAPEPAIESRQARVLRDQVG